MRARYTVYSYRNYVQFCVCVAPFASERPPPVSLNSTQY